MAIEPTAARGQLEGSGMVMQSLESLVAIAESRVTALLPEWTLSATARETNREMAAWNRVCRSLIPATQCRGRARFHRLAEGFLPGDSACDVRTRAGQGETSCV